MSAKNWQGKIMHIELGIEKYRVDFYQNWVVSYYLLYIWFYKVNAARKSKVDDNTAKMQSIKQLGV